MTEATAGTASAEFCSLAAAAAESAFAPDAARSAPASPAFIGRGAPGLPEISPNFTRWPTDGRLLQPLLLAVAGLTIAASILVRPIDHDEGQYVAAIELSRHGWPYLDFAYLQTPLQPILLSPLGMLPAGWLLVGTRVANGIFGILTVALLSMALRGRASPPGIAIAMTALLCSEPFLLASSLARNDALPMVLLAAGAFALLQGLTSPRRIRLFAAAGVLLGLATSAKINMGLPAAAAGVFLLLRRQRLGTASILVFASGALAGLLPTLVLAAFAPTQFAFDNFVYNIGAPRQWWSETGHSELLEARYRVPILMVLAAQGAALIGTISAAIDRQRCDDRFLLDLMIVGALISAYLPVPAFSQYLVPLLPLAAMRFAFAIDGVPQERMRFVFALTCASCVLGLGRTGWSVVQTAARGSDLVYALGQGREVAEAADGQPIATLSPERVAGSDTNLDREFVAGPFLFRTSDKLAAQALRYSYSPNWQRISSALDKTRPRVIVTGGEAQPHPPLFPSGLDAPLLSWAEKHNYRRRLLSGGLILWRRP